MGYKPIEILSFTFTASETEPATTAKTIINVTIIFLPFFKFVRNPFGIRLLLLSFYFHCKDTTVCAHNKQISLFLWQKCQFLNLNQLRSQ